MASNSTPILSASASTKSPKFSWADFKRWQQKMLFYLTTLNLTKYHKESVPCVNEDATDNDKIICVDA